MSEVKIYTIESDQLSPPVTGDGFCVDMVRHSDYAKLEAKLNIINDLTEAAEQANKLAQEATKKLVQERNALAAENAGLKGALSVVIDRSNEPWILTTQRAKAVQYDNRQTGAAC